MAKNLTRSIIAVEASPAYLKLVEFLPLENQIAMVAVKPLDISQWGNDEYLSQQLRETLTQYVDSAQVDLVAAVPSEHAVLRLVEIPEGEENVLDALQWDMEQYLARPLKDYLMDYQAIGPNAAENGRLYLVAAYRHSEVERLRRWIESTGYPLVVLDVDAFALVNAFEANYPEMQEGRALLIKADVHALTCVRAQHGLFFGSDTSSVDAGLLDLSGQAKTDRLLDLVQEIRLRFEAAQSAWSEVETVVVCGDLALDAEFRELLAANLPVPLVPLNAFKEAAFALEPEQSARLIPSGPQCAGVVGLALRRGGDC